MCNACESNPLQEITCPEQLPGSLRRLYLFKGLSDAELGRIATGLKTLDLEEDRWLYRQGDAADHFYLVKSGQIALFRQSPSGRESIVAILSENELFAEDIVFQADAQYDLHARSIGKARVVRFDSAPLRSLVPGSIDLCRRLLETQHRRQQVLLDHIERLTLFNATQRVLAYLLDQVEAVPKPQPVELSVPKSTLASHLSIQPETLSRALAKLRDCNYLLT